MTAIYSLWNTTGICNAIEQIKLNEIIIFCMAAINAGLKSNYNKIPLQTQN